MSARWISRWRGAAPAILLVALACDPRTARAQDFGSAAPAIPDGRLSAALEHGLLPARVAPGFELGWVSWHGVPDLATRSAVAGGGWRGLRAIAGISQTGDEELGWSALGLAAGCAGAGGGVALRAAGRRDRERAGSPLAPGPGTGYDAGVATWIEAGPALRVWISGPQIVTRGESPPLRRGLEWGAWFGGGGLEGWVARSAAAGPGPGAVRRLGARLRNGPLAIWAEARDQPVRGTIGIAARLAGVGIDVSVESHPVLGETVRASLEWRRGRNAP